MIRKKIYEICYYFKNVFFLSLGFFLFALLTFYKLNVFYLLTIWKFKGFQYSKKDGFGKNVVSPQIDIYGF